MGDFGKALRLTLTLAGESTLSWRLGLVFAAAATGALFDVAGLALFYLYMSELVGRPLTHLPGGLTHLSISLVLPLLWLAVALKCAFLLLAYVKGYRIAFRMHEDIAGRLLFKYLHQPYEYHLARNSAVLAHNAVHLPYAVCFNVVLITIYLVTEIAGLAGILLLAALIAPAVFVTMAIPIMAAAWLLFAVLKPIVRRKASLATESMHRVGRLVANSLGGVREVKIHGAEAHFSDQYRAEIGQFARLHGFLPLTQRFINTLVEFILMAAILTGLSLIGRDPARIAGFLPLVMVAMVAGLRGVQSMIRIGNNLQSLQYDSISAGRIVEDLKLPVQPALSRRGFCVIELRHAGYRYESRQSPALRDISLSLANGECVAITGPSGAGKSTLVDLLLGLITPTAGEILVDGGRLEPGQRLNASYVPQAAFLTDRRLRDNIAFGVPPDRIDEARLAAAIEGAHLTPVIRKLPEGLDTLCGERGAHFSGGERQRIAIARALYPDPDLVVLDEATAALDLDTKNSVMETIAELRGRVTSIVITHDPHVIALCDRVVVLEEGRIVSDSAGRAMQSAGPRPAGVRA